MTILTVTQPYSSIWITLFKPYIILDGVAPLMTDPPLISSTTLNGKKKKNVTRDT